MTVDGMRKVYLDGGQLPAIIQDRINQIEPAIYIGWFNLIMDILDLTWNAGYVTKHSILECLKTRSDPKKFEGIQHFLEGGDMMEIVRMEVASNMQVIVEYSGGS